MSEGKTTSSPEACYGGHRFHVADVAVVQDEGKVFILSLCLNCGQGNKNEFIVAQPQNQISKIENRKEKQS